MAPSKRWNATTLLQLGRAFWETRVFLTAVELDIFSLLAAASLSAREVAERRQTDPRATMMLLDALAALGLLDKDGQMYQLEPGVVPLLTADPEPSILPMVQHEAQLWPLWSRLTDVVRTGKAPQQPPYEVRSREEAYRSFVLGMHVVGRMVADAMVAAVELKGSRRLLDVGGASGTYTIAFLKASNEMTATLFDLPPVMSLARERLTREGYIDRVTLYPGDFYQDDLPGGHDLAWLSAIIHQNSREQNRQLYRKVYAALVPNGRIVLRDHIMDASRTQPAAGALFAINMLVATEGGGTYTFSEIKEDLEAAGFSEIRALQADKYLPEYEVGASGLVQAIRR